jgi:tRNA modification GTPase
VKSGQDLAGEDTIVGIATPPGTGAIGVVRVSGPEATSITTRLLRLRASEGLGACQPRTLHLAAVVDPSTGADLDMAVVSRMPGPSSYTGEDVVEISCHGNPMLLAAIVRHLVAAGARLAEPGEFSRRAYLNGRMDLLQAEAVAALIAARTERAVQLAARQLRGHASAEMRAVRGKILDLRAGLEVTLDFPEEGVGLSAGEARAEVGRILGHVDRLTENARRGRAIQEGLSAVLVGAPNAGKSSLLNRLLGTERAIVSALPGTTRDLIDGTVPVDGVSIRLVDGAGLGTPRDPVDAEGMRRIRESIASSDLVIVVLDMSRPVSEADQEVLRLTAAHERVVLGNKIDVAHGWQGEGLAQCTCSALTGEGLESVLGWLEQWVRRRTAVDADEGGIVASVRVLDGLMAAREHMLRVADGLDYAPLEATLVDLSLAQVEIDRILGIEADGGVLDRIFASFCLGK